MSTSRTTVDAAVAAVDAAIAHRDLPKLQTAYGALASAPKEALADRSAEIGPRLARQLPEMPAWHAAVYAVLVGALVEWDADAGACAPPLLEGLRKSLEQGIEFARLWRETHGEDEEPPDPTGLPSPAQQKAFGDDYADIWHAPYFGWLTVAKWESAAVAVLADPAVRRSLGNRDELVALTEQLEPEIGDLQCVQKALLLLDEEPLLVLDRASGQGFRLRMSGIADNYQLQTLLAAVLIGGGHLPGDAPGAEAVALSTDAPFDPGRQQPPHRLESFNFAEPSGRWIWSATTPSRIPVVDGVRQLVLDAPVFRHDYATVRFLPRVSARLALEAVLTPAEAAPYFSGVRELMSWQEASRLAADGY
ncbi:hypothetical protein [Streptomyces sp. NBC_00690]|uniref:hypothetical protein n=1 Tax=Streptomyces sp. NBC_00690 TaxID=2975808 RepID=UPI002E2993E0|nr:hypothetical protein [Streptomyces sp. NBC_00690]